MATRKSTNTRGFRQVGSKAVKDSQKMSDIQEIMLGAVVAFCFQKDCAVFIGTRTTTGSVRLNFYPGDDKCSTSLSLMEDWTVEIPAVLSDVFEEDISLEDLLRAAPWAARKSSEAPRGANLTRRSSGAGEGPQSPS